MRGREGGEREMEWGRDGRVEGEGQKGRCNVCSARATGSGQLLSAAVSVEMCVVVAGCVLDSSS